ncbi:MAG TPA: hypothetical protein VM782_24435, partial [Stellaceae bacterium]|nr:hypothetical protein [Stellaceae bacterium]
MASPPPNPVADEDQSRAPTALSGVFRRIASETPEPPPAPVSPPRPVSPRPFVSVPPPRPVPRPFDTAERKPHLLGFAEPVTDIPPLEDFLAEDQTATPPGTEPAQTAALEATAAPSFPEAPAPVEEASPPAESPPAPEPAAPAEAAAELGPLPSEPEARPTPPLPQPVTEPPAVRARMRDLPPRALEPMAPGVASHRPTSLVGRLGRRLGDMYMPPEHSPRFEALPSAGVDRVSAQPLARSPEPAPQPAPTETRPPPAQKLVTPAPSPAPATERGGRPALPRNRRLYRRAKIPAEIEIDGVPCTLIDVSIGGFAATGVPPLEPNAAVSVMLRLTIDGIEVGTMLKAR